MTEQYFIELAETIHMLFDYDWPRRSDMPDIIFSRNEALPIFESGANRTSIDTLHRKAQELIKISKSDPTELKSLKLDYSDGNRSYTGIEFPGQWRMLLDYESFSISYFIEPSTVLTEIEDAVLLKKAEEFIK